MLHEVEVLRRFAPPRLGRFVVPALLLLLILFPFVVNAAFYVHLMILVFLFAYLGQAWNILGGYTGQVSLGHAVFLGLGAYTSTLLFEWYGVSPWIGMIAGGLVAMAFGLIIGLPTFRLQGHYFAIATIAVGESVLALFNSWDLVGGASGIYRTIVPESWWAMQFHSSKDPYYFIALGLVVTIFTVTRLIERSRLGYYFRAIKEDPDAAKSLGIDTTRYKLYSMMISAFFTGLAGTLYVQYLLFIDPEMVFLLMLSIQICLVPVLGGVGTLWGPAVGAAILIPISEFTRGYLGGSAAGLDLVVYGALIMLVAAYKPAGIMGLLRKAS